MSKCYQTDRRPFSRNRKTSKVKKNFFSHYTYKLSSLLVRSPFTWRRDTKFYGIDIFSPNSGYHTLSKIGVSQQKAVDEHDLRRMPIASTWTNTIIRSANLTALEWWPYYKIGMLAKNWRFFVRMHVPAKSAGPLLVWSVLFHSMKPYTCVIHFFL